jgi:hypothetical protein
MSQENFERFRNLVLEDASLQQKLRGPAEYADFIELVTKVGNECGYDFTKDEVVFAYNAGRRAWIERWLTR